MNILLSRKQKILFDLIFINNIGCVNKHPTRFFVLNFYAPIGKLNKKKNNEKLGRYEIKINSFTYLYAYLHISILITTTIFVIKQPKNIVETKNYFNWI